MPLPQRLIAKTRRLQRQALHNNKLSREDTHSKKSEARNRKARRPPVSSHPNLLDSHRSIRRAPSTTLIARRRLGSLPLHPVKDHTRKGRSPGANFLFPIDLASSRAERSRGASAPLSRLATNAALQRSRGCSRGASAAAAPGDELRSLRGGGDRNRTDDLLLAKQALSQLSYTPSVSSEAQNRVAAPAALGTGASSCMGAALAVQAHRCRGLRFRLRRNAALSRLLRNRCRGPTFCCAKVVVGQGGFEPPTSRLSSARSNQLSY